MNTPTKPMLVHFNGCLVPPDQAHVSVFDRGFLFGDGLYEGLRAEQGVVVGLAQHIHRLREGMIETRQNSQPGAFDPETLGALTTELLRANNLTDASVYWQISRGAPGPAEPLRQRTPPKTMRPTVFGFATPCKPVSSYVQPEARRAALRPDTRWLRGHVKSISLLGGVLAAIEAEEQGCDDAVLFKDELVTEGTATNVFLVPRGGDHIVTPSLESAPMLAGVTRILLMDADPTIEERPVTVDELKAADEIMLAGSFTMVVSVTHLDARPVGKGVPGPHATSLLRALVEAIGRDVHSARHGRNQTTPARR